MKKNIFFLMLILMSAFAVAQDVVLDKNVDEQYQEDYGPNMKRYGHFYFGIGLPLPVGETTGAKINPAGSSDAVFGYRYKFRLLSFFAVGMDLSHSWTRYGILNDSDVPVIVAVNPLSKAGAVEKLSLDLNSLGAEAFGRINIGKRGNVMGNYFDFGIKQEWNYVRKFIVKENAPKGSYYAKSRSVERNLNFISNFSTILTARIGVDKYAVYGKYRISDIITGGYTTPELTPYVLGFEYAF
jgi:hypothetical protein